MKPTDLRVALFSPSASARFGGEAILSLHYFRRLRARGIDAWLVCHDRTWEELRQLLGEDFARVVFIRDTRLHRLLSAAAQKLPPFRGLVHGLIATDTQRLARRELRRLVRDKAVNVVHQASPVSPTQPSWITRVDAPVIIGPMNGGMSYPSGFATRASLPGRVAMAGFRMVAGVLNRVIDGKHRAAALLVANQRTASFLPRGSRAPVVELVENGVDLSLFSPKPAHRDDGPLRVLFAGRLIEWKGVEYLLRAWSKLPVDLPMELLIAGTGPDHARLESIWRQLGSAQSVKFLGFRPQPQIARLMQEADVFVLPSVYECGGAVVLEAMACGLPCVAVNWGGPADYLTPDTGILLDASSPQQLVDDLVATLSRLARDTALRQRLGQAARQRVAEHFDWERKIDTTIGIYTAIAAGLPPPTCSNHHT